MENHPNDGGLWEALAWWLPEALASHTAGLILRKPVLMVVGLVLGRRFRSLRDDLATFRRNRGRGDVAARLIQRAPDFEKAASIFYDFRTVGQSVEGDRVNAAMVERLRVEGPTEATLQFLFEPSVLEIRRDDFEDDDQYAYEWDVKMFEEDCESDGGGA